MGQTFISSMKDSAKMGTWIFILVTIIKFIFKLIFMILKSIWCAVAGKQSTSESSVEENRFNSVSPAEKLRTKLLESK